MMTFAEKIANKKASCNSLEDWIEAFEWLEAEAKDANQCTMDLEHAIIEKYGEKALDELLGLDVEPKFTESQMAALDHITNKWFGTDNAAHIKEQAKQESYEILNGKV